MSAFPSTWTGEDRGRWFRLFESQPLPSRDTTDVRELLIPPQIARGALVSYDDNSPFVDEFLSPHPNAAEATEHVTFEALLQRGVHLFVAAIKNHLAEDAADAASAGTRVPSPRARDACGRLAHGVAQVVVFDDGLKRAAYAEEDGSVFLVLQSLVSDRRIEYQISPDGLRLTTHEIDEQMQHRSAQMPLEDVAAVQERAKWVVGRA